MWIMLFFILPTAGLAYVMWHVWRLLPVTTTAKWAAIILCLMSFATVFLNFSRAVDSMPMPLARACYEVGTSAIFILLYLVLMFLLLDLGRLTGIVPRTWLHRNGYAAAAVTLLTAGIFVYGYLNYMNKRRSTVELTTAKPLPEDLRMVMMSDLHLGYHNGRKELARWVDMVNAERPDLVLIAGDIVDMSLRPLHDEGMAEELRRIEAPAYACFGNHEYHGGAAGAAAFFREAGITLLCDSAAEAGGIVVIGRDDRSNPHRKSLGALMRGVDKSKYIVMLDHQPYHLEQAERTGVDLQLSGHTHRGQVWPVSWITDAIYEDSYGPWRRGRTHYYVSSGMGIWGGKFRIGTCSEYVVITLRSTAMPKDRPRRPNPL